MTRIWSIFGLAVLVVAGSEWFAQAQDAPKLNLIQELDLPPFAGGSAQAKPAEFSASFTVERDSRRGTLSLTANVEPEWHIYSLTQKPGGTMPSKITPAASTNYKLLGAFQPDRLPSIKQVAVYPVPIEEHEGSVTWTAPIELAEGVKPESLTIELQYDGQVCKEGDDGLCIPIFGEKLVAAFAGYSEPPAGVGEYRPAPSQAQVVLEGHLEPAVVTPGGKARLVITAKPNPGWHVYAYATKDPDIVGGNKPTLIHLAPLPGWALSPVNVSSPPKEKTPLKPGLPQERFHDEPVSWTIEMTAPADSPTGETVITGYVGLQTCKEGCLPPHAVQFRASIPIKAVAGEGRIPLEFIPLKRNENAAAATVASYADVARLAAEAPAPASEFDLAGLLPAIGFGLLGGLILNLMPCVLPVIGLKLLSFAQQGGQSRATIFALNFWFAVGLLLVFLVLATLASFGSLIPGIRQDLSWGQQFTLTWFKVAMVVLVFAMALAFLGVWEIPIPGFAHSKTSSELQQRPGMRGAFFKGIFTTLLATPCSGPFLGPVFAYTLAQPPLVTYLIFASVGVGMASPYLLIGAFPALIRWLPKPGPWMETVKQLLGFVLLATVVYLFATINAEYFIPTLALVVGVWFACWIIGRVPHYEPVSKQAWAWISGCAAAAVVGWAAFTFLTPAKELLAWEPYSPEALTRLQSEGKTVMVDFTADWCLTCQYNMKYAINTRRVEEIVKRNGVVPLVADWTDQNPMIKQKLLELQSNSIPLLAIYPASRPEDPIILRDALIERQVLTALEEAGPSKAPTAAATKGSGATVMAQPSG
jgi:thiol:disulfide interchange protein